jgi:hypothetical protein
MVVTIVSRVYPYLALPLARAFSPPRLAFVGLRPLGLRWDGGVVGAPPAGRSRFLSLGGPLPGSLRGVRAPPGASAIASSLPGRRDPASTLRPRRDRRDRRDRRERRDRRNRLARPRPGRSARWPRGPCLLARWPRAHRWRRNRRDHCGRGPAAIAVTPEPAVIRVVVFWPARHGDARFGGTGPPGTKPT